MKEFEVVCPHCKEFVIIEQINCGIFRHGVFKKDLQQISSHLSKINCDNLKHHDLIYGCGKPFKLEQKDNKWIAIECDYI